MKLLRSLLAGVGCVAALAASAFAAPQPSPAGIRLDNWAFTPVVDTPPGGAPRVVGFLGLKDKATATGNNLVAVWYERPAIDGDDWIPKTFDTTSHWDAINGVKAGYGISSDHDGNWITDETDDGGSTAATFVAFSQGLIATDPLAAQLQGAPSRDFWIDVLTDSGYKAADVTFDKGATGTCDQWGWLEEMKIEVETTLTNTTAAIAGADRFHAFVQACQATTPGTGVAEVLVMGKESVAAVETTIEGVPDPNSPGNCKYTKCEFYWERRVVSVLNPNGPGSLCYCERRGVERCITCTPGAACPTNPNGSCPNGTNPNSQCGAAVASLCVLPPDGWRYANWQRQPNAVPCSTQADSCP